MRHVVFGTAGHIDHGKTALVRALTGIDCDRLPEEKSRGITIDLGFAHLEGEGLRLHFVDVPGHERLVHTMIAGASGIDLALLVVAADEGIMPQTREHLEIIRLMGVRGGAVALTKIDLVDPDLVELVAEEVADLLDGTPFAGVPVVPVSAHTGEGVEALRETLLEVAASVRPRQMEGRPFREAVDRVFTLPGVGTVVTGTSLWGRLEAGAPVVVLPSGRKSRARRLHVHGEERERVEAGERVAINLAGLAKPEVHRGDQVMTGGGWRPTRLVTVRLELLPSAPGPLREGAEVELHALATRSEARIERLSPRPLPPGGRAVAQIGLDRPMVLFPGDRVVLRRPAPVNTFGGGMVLDAHLRRVRRKESAALETLPDPERDAWPALLGRWIAEAGAAGMDRDALAARLGVLPEAIEAALGRLLTSEEVVALPTQPPRLVAAAEAESVAERARAELENRLGSELVSTGVPARDFAQALLPQAAHALADAWLAFLRTRGALELVDGRVVPPGSREHVTRAGQELAERIDAIYREAGLAPPSPAEVAARLGARPVVVEGVCRYLTQRGVLVRLAGKLLIHRTALLAVAHEVMRWPSDELSVGEFKQRFGLTRKLAIPVLEWLDSERITARAGSNRRVLKRA